MHLLSLTPPLLLLIHSILAAPQAAVPIPTPTTITSTKLTPVTSCSCTTKTKIGQKTSTYTFLKTTQCSSLKLKPTCKTTTSTSKITITSTITPTQTSTPSPTPVANAGPRGLAYNNATLTLPFSLSGQNSKVSWAYNWYSSPFAPGAPQPPDAKYNPAIEFTPMLWSTAADLTSVWTANVANARAKYGAKAVLAFNEPDLCWDGSSCMSVAAAVEGWKKWVEPLKGQVKLGAPGVSNSANAGQGLEWLKQFLSDCKVDSGALCGVDFVPVHWYGDAGDRAGFQAFVTRASEAGGGRKLWVTEFGTTSGTAEQTRGFLRDSMVWLDGPGKTMVERYAWFMDRPGNLINANGEGLSELGKLYNSG